MNYMGNYNSFGNGMGMLPGPMVPVMNNVYDPAAGYIPNTGSGITFGPAPTAGFDMSTLSGGTGMAYQPPAPVYVDAPAPTINIDSSTVIIDNSAAGF